MIDPAVLKKYGASLIEYEKNEIIFFKDELPHFYYQIESGEIKMNDYNDDGKEFIQGLFSATKSFGEPPLFGDFKYPANATAINSSKLWRLGKTYFFKLLEENPEILMKFTRIMAKRLLYKAIRVSDNSNQPSEHRILSILDYTKNNSPTNVTEKLQYEVKLTRQQIADLTGLRVETVIRSIKKLVEEGELRIENRKVYR